MLERFTHTNSKGETLDFVSLGIFINYNQLRNYEWSVQSENNQIKGFTRGIVKKTIPFVFYVSEEKSNLIKDMFFEHFEIDVLTGRKGYFLINGYKYHCFVTKSVKSDYLISERHLKISVETTTDTPYWKKEKTSTIDFKNITGETNALKYPFAYPFTYKGSNSVNVINEAFFESDAIIRVYGEAINPLVMIGDNVYQVNDAISEKEYIEINTSERTIYKFSVFGDKTNIFEKRNKQYDIFKRVPSGSNIVSANGLFKVDIVIMDKRSEPKWT